MTFSPRLVETLEGKIPLQQLKWTFQPGNTFQTPEFQREIHGIEVLTIQVLHIW